MSEPSNDTCPTQTVLIGACEDCRKYRPAIETVIAARRRHLRTAISMLRTTETIPWGEIKNAKASPHEDVFWHMPVSDLPECARSEITARLDIFFNRASRVAAVAARIEKLDFWRESVPKKYRETKIELHPNPELVRTLLKLTPLDASPGVLAFGSTGLGKTRALLLLLNQWMQAGHTRWRFKYIEGSAIADAANAKSRTGGVGDWVEELCETNALFIDDIGHGNFSNSYAEALRRIVERCTSRGIPLLVTCQFDGKALLKQWAREEPGKQETAKAIIRRLVEFCRPIKFTRAATNTDAE